MTWRPVQKSNGKWILKHESGKVWHKHRAGGKHAGKLQTVTWKTKEGCEKFAARINAGRLHDETD
jgi:hypothetical protein